MSMPFYVSPEQVMKDRADYARKGIARGRSLVALECAAGVLRTGVRRRIIYVDAHVVAGEVRGKALEVV